MVTLLNGERETLLHVTETVSALKYLFMNDLMTAYELADLARGSGRQLSSEAEDMLRAFGLIQEDGTLYSYVRNIVRSAIVGEGFDMELINPVRE